MRILICGLRMGGRRDAVRMGLGVGKGRLWGNVEDVDIYGLHELMI